MGLAETLSILAAVMSVSNFVMARKDKAVKDKSEQDEESSNQKLIGYRLDQVEKKLDKILDFIDSYDKEIDERITKAMNLHIKLYHSKGV